MRYCPNCKKKVQTSLTAGQIVLGVVLFLVFFPAGIAYCCLHTRKCPNCGCATEPIKEGK